MVDTKKASWSLEKNRTKHWETCAGDCTRCWPLVYKNCKSPKKVSRTFAIAEAMLVRMEAAIEKEAFEYLVNRIQARGYVEIMGVN